MRRASRPIVAIILALIVGTLAAPSAVAGASAAEGAGCDRARFPLVIDVGHYPAAPGAISARGVPEYAFNRELAATVLAAFRHHGFSGAHLLDAAGTAQKLPARVARLRELKPPLVLSIHHNSVQPRYLETWTWQGGARRYSDRFHGYSLFVSRRNGDFARSFEVARLLGEALLAAGLTPTLHHAEDIDGERRPLLDARLGIYAGDGLAILAHDGAPAVLIEAGIIVNRDEEVELASAGFRRRVADALTRAVIAYCATASGMTPTANGDER